MKKVLCIHAHESNIYYLERLLVGMPCIIEHKIISLANQSIYTKKMLRKEINNFFSDDVIACVLTCTVLCSILD